MITYGQTLPNSRPARRPARRHPEWTRYGIYTTPSGEVFLAKNSDRSPRTRLKTFATVAEGSRWLTARRDDPAPLRALWNAHKPARKATPPKPVYGRLGPQQTALGAPAPAEAAAEVMDRWGFRGIEFGKSISAARRLDFLGRLHQAMSDLDALGLGCIGTGVGISVGIRTRRNSYGHYEPSVDVVSFPANGAGGSLAHELWHAFERRLGVDGLGVLLASVPPAMVARSRRLDRSRRGRYFAAPRELTARAFESVVRQGLSTLGIVNSWLVHLPEYTTDPEMQPYPTVSETTLLAQGFREALGGVSPKCPPQDVVPQPAGTAKSCGLLDNA